MVDKHRGLLFSLGDLVLDFLDEAERLDGKTGLATECLEFVSVFLLDTICLLFVRSCCICEGVLDQSGHGGLAKELVDR